MAAVTSSYYSWDNDPDNNANVGNITWAEQQAPSSVNNSSRSEMAHASRYRDDTTATITSTGTDNNYAVTIKSQVTSYFRGLTVVFQAHARNDGACTLAVTPEGGSSLGSQPLRAISGQELGAGDIQANVILLAYHNGIEFLLANPAPGTTTVDNLDANTRGLLGSVGDVEPWFGDLADLATEKPGYLHCDGSAVSRSSYAQLFARWGTRFGAGDGSTTFNLPDFRGQFMRGLDGRGVSGEDPDEAGRTAADKSATVVGVQPGSRQKHALQDHEHRGSNVGSEGPTGAMGFGDTVNSQTVATTSSGPNPGSLPPDNLSQNETRSRNVGCYWIVLADAAAAGAQATYIAGLSGLRFTYDGANQDTTSNPGVGRFRLNTTNLDTFTEIALNDQTADTGNADVRSVIDTWGVVAGTNKGTLKISRSAGPEIFVQATLTATNGQTGYTRLTVPGTGLKDGFNGTFQDGESFSFDFFKATPGTPGPAGNDGVDGGYPWNYDDDTDTTQDPGAGNFRLNAGLTELAINATNSGGGNVLSWLRRWDDSTTSADRGSVGIKLRTGADANFINLRITGAITADNGVFIRFPVASEGTDGTIPNGGNCSVQFARTGNEGGSTGGEANDGTNLGAGVGVFVSKSGVNLQFRSLLATAPVVVAATGGAGNETATHALDINGLTNKAAPDDTDSFVLQESGGSFARSAWLALIDALLARVNTWVRGQRKSITVLSPDASSPPEYTPIIDDSNDFHLGAAFTEQRRLNVPSATTGLASNTSVTGEITGSTGAGGSLILGPGWDTVDAGGITIGASETFTLYYRKANLAGTTVDRIVKVKWTA